MDDDELMAQMGMPISFGKRVVKKQVNLVERLEKAKRQGEVRNNEASPLCVLFLYAYSSVET